jgi:hypothetical protein
MRLPATAAAACVLKHVAGTRGGRCTCCLCSLVWLVLRVPAASDRSELCWSLLLLYGVSACRRREPWLACCLLQGFFACLAMAVLEFGVCGDLFFEDSVSLLVLVSARVRLIGSVVFAGAGSRGLTRGPLLACKRSCSAVAAASSAASHLAFCAKSSMC